MPRNEKDPTFQPELPGFGKSKKIKQKIEKALDPPKEKKENSNLYQFPERTPITWKYRSFYGDSLGEFQAIKIPNQKKNGLQAWKLVDGVPVSRTTENRYGQRGFIPAGEIVGMYTRGAFSPKKS